MTDLSVPTNTIRGTYNRGLNSQGVLVRNCEGLSKKHIITFQKRGDRGAFNRSMINKLFPSSTEESKDVMEVAAISEFSLPSTLE